MNNYGELRSFGKDTYIKFVEKTHQYFDPEEQEYTSVSHVLKKYYEPFDAKKISGFMSGGDSKKQKRILKEWDDKKNNSIDHGNAIHNALENYQLGKVGLIKDSRLVSLAERLSSNFSVYFQSWPEVILYSKKHKVAGQTDKVSKRQGWKIKQHVFDFFDYKTNLEQGIRYDSIGWNKDPIKHYNRYLLSPVDHLEDCNYNKYSLQLSLYALMAQMTYGILVGKLFIIFIWVTNNGSLDYKFIPVPYMKMEAMAILNDHMKLKKLPS